MNSAKITACVWKAGFPNLPLCPSCFRLRRRKTSAKCSQIFLQQRNGVTVMVQLLIVDDEPLVQIGIRSMLNWESMGIEIAGTATNGRQAYDIILEKHPEIVITDIKMPIMDGMQLIEKCQSQEHPPLFILLTSYEEFALVKQAISYQVLDYLVKLELTEDVLNAVIQKALGILEKERKQAAIPETGSDLSLLQDNFYIRLLLKY